MLDMNGFGAGRGWINVIEFESGSCSCRGRNGWDMVAAGYECAQSADGRGRL